LFDESSSPGQTAKLVGLSATGFNFAMNVGGKNQGDSSLGDKGGSFSPDGEREDESQKDYQKVSFHGHLPQKKFPKIPFPGQPVFEDSTPGESIGLAENTLL
jgi:hypothetical protein